jgi:hypothetical protein
MPDVFIGERWGKGVPILLDSYCYCPTCDRIMLQRVLAYEDIEIHECSGKSPPHKTYWRPGGKHQLELVEEKVKDATRVLSDAKRTVGEDGKRQYLTEKRKKELGIE